MAAMPATPVDLWAIFLHFMSMSLLSIGGAVATVPDIHRFVVEERGWLSDVRFTESIALAQAAPGPNLLFVAVIGWNVAGAAGVLAAMTGMLLPSTTLAWAATRWGLRRRDHPGVRAFTGGMSPITVGLLLSSSWVLAQPVRQMPMSQAIGGGLLIVITVGVMLRTKLSPMILIALGAIVGAWGGA
jgi:chromate transporter